VTRLFRKLGITERIALVLTVLYGVGVVALLQYDALYLGFQEIDFLRIKPILVGVQYGIYISLPIVVFVVPACLVARLRGCIAIRMVFAVFSMAFLFGAAGMMLHYFLPYSYKTNVYGVPSEGLAIILNVWKIYFHFGVHWMGLLLLAICTIQIWHFKETLWLKKTGILCGILGMVTLVYPFNEDFYMNVSQSAGGGAPKAGILTLVDPGSEIKNGNQLYATEDAELSKPCFLLYEDDECALISEMFLNHRFLKSLNHNSITRSIFRYDKSKIRQFTPISYYQMWNCGNASIITNSLSGDVIQHLDFCAMGLMVPVDSKKAGVADVYACCMTTNMPEMVMWIDNDGCTCVRANHVSLAPSLGSNIVAHMTFPTIPFARGVQIWQWERMMTNECPNVGIRIDNLPKCPVGYQWRGLVMNFRCNFIYDIILPWEKTIIDDKTLVARKKREP